MDSDRVSRRLAVRDYFHDNPDTWVPTGALEKVGGRTAWRTRVSECRRMFGMTIDNQLERRDDGSIASSYRYKENA